MPRVVRETRAGTTRSPYPALARGLVEIMVREAFLGFRSDRRHVGAPGYIVRRAGDRETTRFPPSSGSLATPSAPSRRLVVWLDDHVASAVRRATVEVVSSCSQSAGGHSRAFVLRLWLPDRRTRDGDRRSAELRFGCRMFRCRTPLVPGTFHGGTASTLLSQGSGCGLAPQGLTSHTRFTGGGVRRRRHFWHWAPA